MPLRTARIKCVHAYGCGESCASKTTEIFVLLKNDLLIRGTVNISLSSFYCITFYNPTRVSGDWSSNALVFPEVPDLGCRRSKGSQSNMSGKWREAANFGGSSADCVILHVSGPSCNHSAPF
jgi:hypothetical protein